MSSAPGADPGPDFELASAFPEVTWLRQAAAAADWAAVRQYHDSLPPGTDRAFVVGVLAKVDGFEHTLRQQLAAVPYDVLALTVLGLRLIEAGWEIRTDARANDVSREQFKAFHEHLGEAEQLLIRATAFDPSYDAAWAARLTTALGLSLGQNESRRRYDRLARYHPHHFTGQARFLHKLYPKWGGTWEAAHGFARECLLAAPAGALNGGLVAEAHFEHWLDLGAGDKRAEYLGQPHVHAELVEAAQRSVFHPQFARPYGWVTVQGSFAAMFSLIGDTAQAAAHFRALGNLASEFPWSHLGEPAEQYVQHRDTALRGRR